MIEESKYCNVVIAGHFNRKLVITKKNDKDFKSSAKCWICDTVYVKVM